MSKNPTSIRESSPSSNCNSRGSIYKRTRNDQSDSRRSPTYLSLQSPDKLIGEREAKLKIESLNYRKGNLKKGKINKAFRLNVEMSLRVAFGVLLATIITKENHDGNNSKRWYFFPDWYYLGGLNYCAVAVIFSARKTIGASVAQVVRAFCGVGMALLFNIALFAYIDVKLFDPSISDDPETQGYHEIGMTINGKPYYVDTDLFYKVLPAIMSFTILMLLLPIEDNTKKFAIANNLYFALKIINPSKPEATALNDLKTVGDTKYETNSIIQNLALYFSVGILGTLISLMILFIPYPLYAIKRLQKETKKGGEDVLQLLNLILDSYCFKNKNAQQKHFLKMQLNRKFRKAADRHVRLGTLLDEIWWEQLLGLHFILHFDRSIIETHVELLRSLISDLRTLSNAMQLETYDTLHLQYMKVLQKEIYVIQMRSGDLLNEINNCVNENLEELNLPSARMLGNQMDKTLENYRREQINALRHDTVTKQDVEGNVPLNLFLFSLHSFCTTLTSYQNIHNQAKRQNPLRAEAIVRVTQDGFFSLQNYSKLKIVSAIKVTLAIFAGVLISVFFYSYDNTVPATVAYIMSNHIGASFSLTVNRVGGVVAGSVVPSVILFFITLMCAPPWVFHILTTASLALWVSLSMYVSFSEGYASYSGVVSAFVAVEILVTRAKECTSDTTTSVAIQSYSTLAMTSIGLLLFVVVELVLCPKSAMSLLRQNIQETLKELQASFEALFTNHCCNETLDDLEREELRIKLEKVLPKLLEEQRVLIQDARAEPKFWKPAFSSSMYEDILDCSYRLLDVNTLLLNLIAWYKECMKNKPQSNSISVYNETDEDKHCVHQPTNSAQSDLPLQPSFVNEMTPTMRKWLDYSAHFRYAVRDTFDSVHAVFGDEFFYADSDQTAVFLQMKEAFRLVDKDGNGEIDASEVQKIFEHILSSAGAVKQGELKSYVAKFMDIVDSDRSGTVSFDEFLHALDDGLKLEVEVYNRIGKKSTDKIRDSVSLQSNREETNATTQSLQAGEDRVSDHTSQQRTISPSNYVTILSPLTREYQVLQIQEFSLNRITEAMRKAYVDWIVDDKKFGDKSTEELILLSCLVSGAESFGQQLTRMEEIIVTA